MVRSSGEQPLNLKHRLTGAAILIGLALGVVSFLLQDSPVDTGSAPSTDTSIESFVSRITSMEDENGAARALAPAAPPVESASGERPASADARTFKPVLKQDHRLPTRVPSLNTVEPDAPKGNPTARVQPMKRDKREVPAAAGEWVLRVGAFAETKNAEGVVSQLEKGGFKPLSNPIEVNGKKMIRVWVGPFPNRKDAVRAKSDIAREFGLNGFVVRQD